MANAIFNPNVDVATPNDRAAVSYSKEGSIPGLNKGSGLGARINSPGYLQSGELKTGQEQVIVHTFNSSKLIDQNEWHTVSGTRTVTVTGNEQHTNKANLVHDVFGTQDHTTNKGATFTYLSTVDYKASGTYNANFYSHRNETNYAKATVSTHGNDSKTNITNSFNTTFGSSISALLGVSIGLYVPLRITAIGGIDLKVALMDEKATVIDLGLTLFSKLSMQLLKVDFQAIDAKVNLAKFDNSLANLRRDIVALGKPRIPIEPPAEPPADPLSLFDFGFEEVGVAL